MTRISAYEARINFGDLLNRVYYRGEEIVVERKGEPMVKITKYEKPSEKKKDVFRKAAGSWKDLDTDKIIKRVYKSRKDNSALRRFLAKW